MGLASHIKLGEKQMDTQDLMDGPMPDRFTAFEYPLDGYYSIQGKTAFLSLIISLEEGRGHVGNLLKEWIEKYETIIVPTPSNKMRGICERRGFKSEIIFFESAECMVWRK